MKITFEALLTLAILSPLPAAPVFAYDKGVYGRDDRVDLFAASGKIAGLADSVVSLWSSADVRENLATGTFVLRTTKFADYMNLCPGEKFREQPSGPFCSGSLVGEDMILTAGHCATNQADCDNMKIVFGFALKSSGASAPAEIKPGEVYSCKEVISTFETEQPDHFDYALIRLDRKVSGHKPLAINRERNIKEGDKLLVIGHPKGLPLKIAGGGVVRNAAPIGYFVTDLDTFGGNSGSPVFNAETGLIEGTLVAGDEDFVRTSAGCTAVATYAQNGGGGEAVSRASAIEGRIPELAKGEKTGKPSFRNVKVIETPAEQADLSRYFSAGFQ